MAELNLSRQSKLVPESELTDWDIKIFGVGSIGSHVAYLLSKTGFKNLSVYDMDIVEEENIGPQIFRFSDLKKNKVDALAEVIKEGAGLDIETHHGQVDEKTDIPLEPKTMYLCFFDSVAGRRMIFDKVKDMPSIFVDGRIGRFDMRHYLVNCAEEKEVADYLTTLPDGEGSDLVCGEKANAFINYDIAGRIVGNIVNFVSKKPFDKRFIGNASNPKFNIHIRSDAEAEQSDASSIEVTTEVEL